MDKRIFIRISRKIGYSLNLKDFPIWLMFCPFPLIALVGSFSYDVVWIMLFAFIVVVKTMIRRHCLSSKYRIFLFIVLSLSFLKYVIPWSYSSSLSLLASVMDGKWIIYLIFVFLWIDTYGYPSVEKIYRYGVFFSMVYVCYGIVKVVLGNVSRAGILMESNYDGLMILIAYCFREQVKDRKWWGDWLMVLATFLTFSRTGIMSLFALWIVKFLRKNILILIPLIPILYVIAVLGMSIRGESASHLDRFVYWEQAFVFFNVEGFWAFLFGNTPGSSLNMPIISGFNWTVEMFDEVKNLNGIFPFMFHSAYLRIAITWGIPVAIGLTIYLIRKFMRSPNSQFRQLCLLTLIQSFSLSTLTLPNVSILFMMAFMLALNQESLLSTKS